MGAHSTREETLRSCESEFYGMLVASNEERENDRWRKTFRDSSG
jgi:hypothetical protein